MFDLVNILMVSLVLNLILMVRLHLMRLANRRLQGQLRWMEDRHRQVQNRPTGGSIFFIFAVAFWMCFIIFRLLS